jgi:hypothetical protein
MLARSALGSKAQLTLTLCPDLEMPLPILVVIEIGNGTWPTLLAHILPDGSAAFWVSLNGLPLFWGLCQLNLMRG